MLIKMKESKGFTLVELMIVVAIIGILAAVAVPFYQRYIQKARLTSMVFPGVHSIETNIGTYYSFKNALPPAASLATHMEDADTACYSVSLTTIGGATGLRIVINSGGTARCGALAALNGSTFEAVPNIVGQKIVSWKLSGALAEKLGLAGEGE